VLAAVGDSALAVRSAGPRWHGGSDRPTRQADTATLRRGVCSQ